MVLMFVWVIFGSDMPWAEAFVIQHVCVPCVLLVCHLLFSRCFRFVVVTSEFEGVWCCADVVVSLLLVKVMVALLLYHLSCCLAVGVFPKQLC